MKRTAFFLLFFGVTITISAQRDQTIFDAPTRVGGFGGPIFEYSGFGQNNEFETASGGGGALVLGDFFLGGYGIGDINILEIVDNNEANIDMGHGGFWLGVTPLQHIAVHPYASLRLGWGAADIRIDEDNFDYSDQFFVVHPEAGVELNVFRWFRVAGTVGYQFFNGLDNQPQLQDLELDNLRVGLTLRFGGFGRRKSDWD